MQLKMQLPTRDNKKKSDDLTNYSSEVSKVLRSEFGVERARLGDGCYVLLVKDEAKFKDQQTFNIDLDGLPNALEQDRVVVSYSNAGQQIVVAKGIISNINAVSKKIKIILNAKPQVPKEAKPKEGEDLKLEIRSDMGYFETRASRISGAINSLNSSHLSPHILNSLLSCYEERNNTKFIKTRALNLAGAPPLSKKQKLAVEQALMKRISLVEGVHGSGKTLVAANIAYSMSRTHKERRKVLLCSSLQSTVNVLAQILASATGNSGQVVQMTPDAITERANGSYDPSVGLRESVRERLKYRWLQKLHKHADLLSVSSALKERKISFSDFWKQKAERQRLEEADIVCCTLEQSLGDCLRGLPFKALIIDDAQYAQEHECLLAISRSSKSLKQVTLLGDMRRSERLVSYSMRSSSMRQNKSRYQRRSSFIADSRLRRNLFANGLNPQATTAQVTRQSLFDRWLERGLPSVVLKFRYRKINKLDIFLRQYSTPFGSSNNNNSSSIKSLNRRVSSIEQPTPSTSSPGDNKTHWVCIPTDGSSWLPGAPVLFDIHSSIILGTLKKLIEDIAKWTGSAPVCILTNYGQDSDLDSVDKSVERGCASDYLGQQRDYIILVCKRFPPSSGEGFKIRRKARIDNDFLVHNEALMIALTRASRGLFILTDLNETILDEDSGQPQSVVSAGDAWKSLVEFCREEDLILQEYPRA